ncbi:unnamed protein product [Tetraodon nigroviridis]|uniref:(spotted green pufferfish) hypothetical protein n=1 Tax=Tetraodon nigroviridis TaxID=99883 RepID=Q4RSE4_TETNG|nr:unnamed protein product [Tetraodon nigroviridis]
MFLCFTGVYLSRYSDRLDQHPWSHAFSSVSANTSSFLAFQRTQCYLYEFLGDGSDETVQCPSAACLYAIVSFLYIDPKLTLITAEYKRSTVVNVDRVISLSNLRRVLPKAIFQTRFSSEVFLDGLYYSLCELVSSEVEQANTLNLLLQEIKAKDVSYRNVYSSEMIRKANNIGSTHDNLLRQIKRRDTSELKRVVQIIGKEPRKCSETDEKHVDASSRPSVDHSDGALLDDAFCRGPQASLRCTIFNSSRKRSSTFLEQMSKRCLQEDLTQASVEEECLIFSEQMKQVLKRSKEKSIHGRTPDTRGNLHLFRSSFAAARCSLQGQEGDPPSFVGLKITVDVSERTSQTDTKEEEMSTSVKHAGVSGVRAGRARLDTGRTDDGRKGPVRQKDVRTDSGHPKTEPGHLSNACVKQESFPKKTKLDGKSCSKTKYRFYILATSDDPCFEKTKVQLEAQGHTAVQPSEFFLTEEASSTLLIILRNEDIAEHICEVWLSVPYLLSLKKCPGVQFAGIDEPDDVVNQIHQELFVRGGFIMFDRAALESLRLRTLSGEAREKKNFISWCQEAGILEVLPYHECDRLSRDQPDYLACLVRLQVQNVSARYPIFITGETNTTLIEPCHKERIFPNV